MTAARSPNRSNGAARREARIPRLTASRAARTRSRRGRAGAAASAICVLTTAWAVSRRDGREYVITLDRGQTTPAPWVNVIANPQFGTVVSESGSRLHLGENRHEFRLTPWHNDPVTDASGEAFYIRDEETGQFWSPTPLPGRGADTLRHPPRFRLQRVRARRRRHRTPSCGSTSRPTRRSSSRVLKLRNHSGRPRGCP